MLSPYSFPVELDSFHSHLDYLDLQGDVKDHFDIKLQVAFDFLKKPGHFCAFPTISATAFSSCGLETETEVVAVKFMHDVLLNRLVPSIHQRWFCWDRVELPTKMLQRIATLDKSSIGPSEHAQLDDFLLPTPLDSLSLPNTFQSPNDTSVPFDLPTSWSDTISSGDSAFPSTFDTPNFTSTPFPRSPALPTSTGLDLAPNDASGVTMTKWHPMQHIAQPNDTTPKRNHSASAAMDHATAATMECAISSDVKGSEQCHNGEINHNETTDPADSVQSTYDVGSGYICGDIGNALLGLSLRHSTMNDLLHCIQQVEGYKADSWKAILVKLGISEEHHHDVIRIMADASRDR
ncbi:hypothetical protein BDR05DRAFT_1006215 [Suillus weaverae]|nr:hypothetical protein BDR05DRAFT_1006215 [Suillus weaverae]